LADFVADGLTTTWVVTRQL